MILRKGRPDHFARGARKLLAPPCTLSCHKAARRYLLSAEAVRDEVGGLGEVVRHSSPCAFPSRDCCVGEGMGACSGRCCFAARAILEAALQQRCQAIFNTAGPCSLSKPLPGKLDALLSEHHDSPNLLNTALISVQLFSALG